MNAYHSLADTMKMPVHYYGENAAGQHLFGNGAPLTTHIYGKLEQAVERFGARIKIDVKALERSAQFQLGRKAKAYAPGPDNGPRKNERTEYALGYLQGLIDRSAK